MNASEINKTFDLVDYVGRLVKLAKKKKYHVGPCPMCGGRDRFTIKRAEGDRWHCRKCGDGKYHTSINFFMAYHNIDFKEALKRMGGDLERPAARIVSRPIHPTPVQVAPDLAWQSDAWRHIDMATALLLDQPAGEPGRRYLTERCISQGMMNVWLLGYGMAFNRPAIFIPYLDIGDLITAVKYRFIDERARKDKGARFAMLGGSLPYLFGLQNILDSDRTLLFVEGELNAISVMQTLPDGVAVVSAGSETNGNVALLRSLAARFDRIVIWMDDPVRALIMRGRMGRDAQLIKSPVLHDVKWDANEMLKAGLLADFLNEKLSIECMGIPAPALFKLHAEDARESA